MSIQIKYWKIHKPNFLGHIVIHSWNSQASKEMHDRLSVMGYNVRRVPFGDILLKVLEGE